MYYGATVEAARRVELAYSVVYSAVYRVDAGGCILSELCHLYCLKLMWSQVTEFLLKLANSPFFLSDL